MSVKNIKVFLILSAIFLCCSCTGEKSLVEQGSNLAEMVSQAAGSKEYVEVFFSEWSEIQKRQESFDSSSPTGVYRLLIKQEVLPVLNGLKDAEKIPKVLGNNIRLLGTDNIAISLITFKGSPRDYAISEVLSAESVFDSSQLKENTAYIYTYKKSYPIMVSFVKGQGKAVYAKARYLIVPQLLAAEELELRKYFSGHEILKDYVQLEKID